MMRKFTFLVLLALLLSTPAWAGLFNKGISPEDQRKAILKRSQTILATLYKVHPDAQKAIEQAYGYATFSDTGIKIFVAGGGRGHGVAVINGTGKRTFMGMREIQAGLGFGVKKFSLIWIFENKEVFESFINSGWTLGAQGTAAVKGQDGGVSFQGAVQVAPGMWVYQLTDKGLALELTVKGTKFHKDDKLNKVEDAAGDDKPGTDNSKADSKGDSTDPGKNPDSDKSDDR